MSVPLADRLLSSVQVLAPTVVVANVQLLPLSIDTYTASPAASTADKLPPMDCAALLVLKSPLLPLLAAVSALKLALAMVLVGALVSMLKALAYSRLSKPLRATTLALMVLLPLRVKSVSDHWSESTVVVASLQVRPPLRETRTFWPVRAGWLKVPLRVWAAVRVTKSLASLPVSALSAMLVMLGGALLSTVMLLLVTSERLPARSVAYKR